MFTKLLNWQDQIKGKYRLIFDISIISLLGALLLASCYDFGWIPASYSFTVRLALFSLLGLSCLLLLILLRRHRFLSGKMVMQAILVAIMVIGFYGHTKLVGVN